AFLFASAQAADGKPEHFTALCQCVMISVTAALRRQLLARKEIKSNERNDSGSGKTLSAAL
ncbi:MAG: hypothetical protein RSB91_11345, partial [Clostridia bacterium]